MSQICTMGRNVSEKLSTKLDIAILEAPGTIEEYWQILFIHSTFGSEYARNNFSIAYYCKLSAYDTV